MAEPPRGGIVTHADEISTCATEQGLAGVSFGVERDADRFSELRLTGECGRDRAVGVVRTAPPATHNAVFLKRELPVLGLKNMF